MTAPLDRTSPTLLPHTTRALRRMLFVACAAAVVLGFASPALAQTVTLRGTVSDAESGAALPGATVYLPELDRGTATDIDGTFALADVPEGVITLRVTFVGYVSVDLSQRLSPGAAPVAIALRPDYAGLEEVVVTGIASATSRARSEVAVARIDAAEVMAHHRFSDVTQLIGGRVAGVAVQPSSGNLGGSTRFTVRASTGLFSDGQPTIYLDGVRVDDDEIRGFGTGGQGVSFLALLSPDAVERVDMLKGPAGTALYGAQGGDGVVLITTKRGRLAGGVAAPLRVSYTGTLGTNSEQASFTTGNASTPDAANALFRPGDLREHALSASGGTPLVRFYTAYTRRDERGHLRSNALLRQSVRANFEAFPTPIVTLRASTRYTRSTIDRPHNDNNIYGYYANTLLERVPFISTDSAAVEGLSDVMRFNQVVGSVEAEVRPFPGLTLRALAGIDASDLRNDQTFPANLRYQFIDDGRRRILQRTNEQLTYDASARYETAVSPRLTTTTTLGAQAFTREGRAFNATREDFSTELLTAIGGGAGDFSLGESFFTTRDLGFYAQQEASVDRRLFATIALRREYASAIGRDAGAVHYPKASIAVRLDRFPRLLPRAVGFAKLRAAYGEAGILPSERDGVPFLWEPVRYGYGPGATIVAIGNTEIEPERRREAEIGLDVELFGAAQLDVTLYRQWTSGGIVDFVLPPSTGLVASAVPQNVGESKGGGWEAALTFAPIRSRAVRLEATVLWSRQTNEVTSLGGAAPLADPVTGINIVAVGEPVAAFYGYATRATFDDDGRYTGPALVNPTPDDSGGMPQPIRFGVPYPEHLGALHLDLRIGPDLTLSGHLDWQLGQHVFNRTAAFQSARASLFRRNVALVGLGVSDPEELDLFDEDGDVLVLPVYERGTPGYRDAAETVAETETRFDLDDGTTVLLDGNFVEDARFVKLRALSLRYDLTRWVRRLGMAQRLQGMAFTLSGRNLWTRTPYSGVDPEVSTDGARSLTRGVDFLTLAPPRTVYGTLTVTF